MRLESLTIAAFVIGSSLTAFAQSAESGIAGAWTSGSDVDACDTSPITHFMSDGVVAVFMKKDGDLHSLGSWSVADTELTMTHNDFPLSGDGKSNPAIKLDILTIDACRRAVYQNKASKELIENFNVLVLRYAKMNTVVLACTELSMAYNGSMDNVLDMAQLQLNFCNNQR